VISQNSFSTTQSTRAGRPCYGAWMLFAPLGAWLLLFVVIPTFILFIYSFFRGVGVGEVAFTFTPSNYLRVFEPVSRRIFFRSLGYAGLTTVLCALIGYPVGYCIGRASLRWRNQLLLLVMIPFWTNFLIRTYAWYTILQHDGLLNAVLQETHLIPGVFGAPLKILYTPTAVLITLIYTYLPFMILPIYGSVEKLDNSLLEAASDLGAGPLRAFWRVTLPLTLPGIGAGVMMVFVPAIAMFAVTYLMGGGKLPLIGDEIHDQFQSAGDLPFGSALGMTLLALFMITYWIGTRTDRRKM
jgi:spermidine/putrescine transport system permease protein